MLIPVTKEDTEAAYLEKFRSWIKLHPDQARYFCEHGFYHGACKPGSYIHRCKDCKEDK